MRLRKLREFCLFGFIRSSDIGHILNNFTWLFGISNRVGGPAFSGCFNNMGWSGYSGCWLRLNPSDADVRFLRNSNCGLAACCAPARSRDIGWSQADYGAAALLRGLYARIRPWYRSTCDCSRSPRFGVPQEFPVSGVAADVITAACIVKSE